MSMPGAGFPLYVGARVLDRVRGGHMHSLPVEVTAWYEPRPGDPIVLSGLDDEGREVGTTCVIVTRLDKHDGGRADMHFRHATQAQRRRVMRFRKKPIVVEAVQFDPSVQPWPEGVHAMVGPWASAECHARALGASPADCGWVPTLEGGHVAQKGDWIITGAKGEKYPCKPDIFAATYEAVPSESNTERGK